MCWVSSASTRQRRLQSNSSAVVPGSQMQAIFVQQRHCYSRTIGCDLSLSKERKCWSQGNPFNESQPKPFITHYNRENLYIYWKSENNIFYAMIRSKVKWMTEKLTQFWLYKSKIQIIVSFRAIFKPCYSSERKIVQKK